MLAASTATVWTHGLATWTRLSTLLMVIIFVLLVFVLAQAFLSVTLYRAQSGAGKATRQLSRHLGCAVRLNAARRSVCGYRWRSLARKLATGTAERDRLTQQISDANLALQAAGVANARLRTQLTDTAGKLATPPKADAANQEAAAAKARLAEMQRQIAELDRTVSVDKETLQAKLSGSGDLDATVACPGDTSR